MLELTDDVVVTRAKELATADGLDWDALAETGAAQRSVYLSRARILLEAEADA